MYTFPQVAETLRVKAGGNVNDDNSGGTGARTVQVYFLDLKKTCFIKFERLYTVRWTLASSRRVAFWVFLSALPQVPAKNAHYSTKKTY